LTDPCCCQHHPPGRFAAHRHYPVPAGAVGHSLEVAGQIIGGDVAANGRRFSAGDRVCALVAGGATPSCV
jgi:hypothetical protein